MEEMKQCRQLGMAAEQAAGKLRAMEWDEWQRMLLGLAHASMMISEVADNAEHQGRRTLANMADADLRAILRALDLLGWEKGQDDGMIS